MPVSISSMNAANGLARSRLLGRLAGTAFAATTAALVKPQVARALWSEHGCNLCNAPAACPSLTCSWCWLGDCHVHSGLLRQHYCCEGYVAGQGCGGGCPAACSWLSDFISC